MRLNTTLPGPSRNDGDLVGPPPGQRPPRFVHLKGGRSGPPPRPAGPGTISSARPKGIQAFPGPGGPSPAHLIPMLGVPVPGSGAKPPISNCRRSGLPVHSAIFQHFFVTRNAVQLYRCYPKVARSGEYDSDKFAWWPGWGGRSA